MIPSPHYRILSLLLLATLTACGGDGNGGMNPSPTGGIRVTVTADGSGRGGVTVRLFAGDGAFATKSSPTASDGTVIFEDLDEGVHAVEVEVPAGFTLDAGVDARKTVSVSAGSIAHAAFAMATNSEVQVVEVLALDNLTFSEAAIAIAPGTTVRWVNQGQILHTVTPDGHSEWTSATLADNGSTFSHTFNTEGEFAYYCEPHLAQGMVGSVTVRAP